MDIKVYFPRDMGEAAKIIEESVGKRRLIVIFGKCSVDYEGRSESRLTEGERLIIIKEDGAFLVHRPTGYSPVNWQPDTSAIRVRVLDDGILELTAYRLKPREIVRVLFSEINTIISGKLVDAGEFVMYMDESEIRDLLYERPDLLEEGMKFIEKEKRLPAGSVDLFGYDKNKRPVIVEIKRVTASKDAVLQLYRYVESYMKSYGVKPRGILVAPSLTQSAIEAANKLGLEYKQVNIQKLWEIKKQIYGSRLHAGRTLLEFLKEKA